MSRELEYYRIIRTDSASISEDTGNPDYLYEERFIENPKLMKFRLRKPIDRKPRMADYHFEPNSIISKKIYDVLSPLRIEGIQLLPAIIKGKDDKIFSDYWAIHIFHWIKCIDAKLSDCKINNGLTDVNKIILDKNKLETIPLNKRLVFRLKEDYAYQLFHVSIVEAIQEVKPEGLRFVDIEKWNFRSHFEN